MVLTAMPASILARLLMAMATKAITLAYSNRGAPLTRAGRPTTAAMVTAKTR